VKFTKTKVFDYKTDMNIADKKYEDTIIKKVPCYHADEVEKLVPRARHPESMGKFGYYYYLRTGNVRGPNNVYIPATSKLIKFIEKQVAFAILKGTIKAPPKLHVKKYVMVRANGRRVVNGKSRRVAVGYTFNDSDSIAHFLPERD